MKVLGGLTDGIETWHVNDAPDSAWCDLPSTTGILSTRFIDEAPIGKVVHLTQADAFLLAVNDTYTLLYDSNRRDLSVLTGGIDFNFSVVPEWLCYGQYDILWAPACALLDEYMRVCQGVDTRTMASDFELLRVNADQTLVCCPGYMRTNVNRLEEILDIWVRTSGA